MLYHPGVPNALQPCAKKQRRDTGNTTTFVHSKTCQQTVFFSWRDFFGGLGTLAERGDSPSCAFAGAMAPLKPSVFN